VNPQVNWRDRLREPAIHLFCACASRLTSPEQFQDVIIRELRMAESFA